VSAYTLNGPGVVDNELNCTNIFANYNGILYKYLIFTSFLPWIVVYSIMINRG